MQKIGEKVRNIRIEKRLSLEFVAAKCDMSVTGYGNIERGQTKDIALSRLSSIADALGVSIIHLLVTEEDAVVPKAIYEATISAYKLCNAQKDGEILFLRNMLTKLMDQVSVPFEL